MEGYLFTATPQAAFDAYNLFPSVRFAAQLEDGSGFAAFDWYHPQMHEFGEVRVSQPLPDYPDTWPDWAKKAGPKRGIANGMEWYARIPQDWKVGLELCSLEAVTGLAYLDDGCMLVESQGPVAVGSLFNTRVIHYEQAEAPVRLQAV